MFLLIAILLQSVGSPAVRAASLAYVTNSASNTVTIVDVNKSKIIAVIRVGKEPFGVAFSPDATRAYVANTQSGELSVIDTNRHRLVQNIRLDGQLPVWVAVSPDGSYVYVTNERSHDVSVVSSASHAQVSRIPVGRGPAGILVSADARSAYVANEGTNDISVLDLQSERVIASINVGSVPQGLAFSPNGAQLYVSNFGSDSISVIATGQRQVVAEIPVAKSSALSRTHGPVAVAASSDGKWLFTGNFKSGTVSVIDVSKRTPMSLVPTGPETFAVAALPDSTRLYAVSSGDRSISVIDTSEFKVTSRIALGDGAYKLALLPEFPGGLRTRHLVFLIYILSLISLAFQAGRAAITPRKSLLLGGILLLALSLRLAGLNWGIPQMDAATARAAPNLRVSFHMDEDTFLWKLTQVRPGAFDYYVPDFHWGTLQYYLIEGALLISQLLGLVSTPWRQAFLEFHPGQYSWLFVAGRATSALLGSFSVLLAYAIGKRLWNERAGIWASLVLAVMPLHVVNSHYLTSDISMCFFLLLAFYFLISGNGNATRWIFLWGGIAFGLALAAKYNAIFLFPVVVLSHLRQTNQSWTKKVWTYLGIVIGFAAGEPYAFIYRTEFWESLRRNFLTTINLPPGAVPSWPELLGLQLKNMALFGMGIPLALAIFLFFRIFIEGQNVERRNVERRNVEGQNVEGQNVEGLNVESGSLESLKGDSLKDKNVEGDVRRYDVRRYDVRRCLYISILLFFVSVLLLRMPMVRYTLPALVLSAIPIGFLLSSLTRKKWGAIMATTVIVATGFLSFLQVQILTREHTANQAYRWIERHVPPGASIIKGWPKIPVINPEKYRVTNFYTQNRIVDLHEFFLRNGKEPFFPDYVLLDNLPTFDFPADFLQTLSRHYLLVAEFKRDPQFWKFTFPEWDAPHDWKYSHPEIRIYRKRRDS